MDLLPDDVQRELAQAVEDLLAAHSSMPRLRDEDCSVDEVVWAACIDQGWFELAVAEEDGGIGFGAVELTLVHRSLGRHLTPGPFLGTTLAALTFPHHGIAAAALVEDGRTTEDADLLLVVDPERTVLAHRAGRADGRAGIDLSAPALVVEVGEVLATGASVTILGDLLVAAQLAGIAEATRDASAAHARVREQFGRPIGSFQLVQERCADSATRADAAVQLVTVAALAWSAGNDPDGQLVASARLVARDAALANAKDCIQNHGGIGYTWECDAHLWLRRVHGLDRVLSPRRNLVHQILVGAAGKPY